MKFSSQLLFTLLLTGIVALYFLLVHAPAHREIAVLQSNIKRGFSRESEEWLLTQSLQEKTVLVDQLREEIDWLKSGLLLPGQYHKLMTDLGELFNRHGLVNLSTSMKDPTKRKGYGVALFDLKVQGEFEKLYRFLLDLEELPYSVCVDTLDIRSTPDGEERLTADLRISAPIDQLDQEKHGGGF